MRRWLIRIAIALVVLFALAQAVPYGRDHSNPPVTAEPKWDSPQTRALAKRSCFDCHSNETRWPWYSNVAPVSWLVQRDVDSGRDALNFSEWGRGEHEGHDAAEMVANGEMPPWYYRLQHSEARLDAAEKAALERGLTRTLGGGQSGEDS